MASSLQERITADRAKSSLARKLLYTSGHSIVATEISDFNNPDIISLTKSDRLVEYEIKVSKADLMGELNSVKTCKNQMLMNTHNRAIQGEQQMQIGDKTVTAHFRGNIAVFLPAILPAYRLNLGTRSLLRAARCTCRSPAACTRSNTRCGQSTEL